jgi:hypothetical protein
MEGAHIVIQRGYRLDRANRARAQCSRSRVSGDRLTFRRQSEAQLFLCAWADKTDCTAAREYQVDVEDDNCSGVSAL